MAPPSPDNEPGPADNLRGLPFDSDLDEAEDRRHHPSDSQSDQIDGSRGSRWPAIHWRTVAVIGLGGFLGGLARYEIGLAWVSSAGGFPWAIFAINTSGAFVLALLLVLVLEVLRPTTYLRPAIGTGFCGAFTTFSSVATATDQLTAHGHADIAAIYVVASLFSGLAAVSFGFTIGRSIAALRGGEAT